VIDGDTITIATKLAGFSSNEIYKFSVRINGIDTPEIKGKNVDEKNVARIAKAALEELIMSKDVQLKNVAFEKYGRLLSDVYINDIHINKWMVEKRFALPYDGGKKMIPQSW
jgi:endonuclease YncB( thermonuclease family)